MTPPWLICSSKRKARWTLRIACVNPPSSSASTHLTISSPRPTVAGPLCCLTPSHPRCGLTAGTITTPQPVD
eukprot:scaffold107306_cov30-Tisochrysis_lutea.AAC.6